MDNWRLGRTAFGRGFGGPGKYVQRAGEIERPPRCVAEAALASDSATWRPAAAHSVGAAREAVLAPGAYSSSLRVAVA